MGRFDPNKLQPTYIALVIAEACRIIGRRWQHSRNIAMAMQAQGTVTGRVSSSTPQKAV